MLSWMCYWLHQFMKNALFYSIRLYFIFIYLQELQMFNFELKLKEWLDVLLEIYIYHFFIFFISVQMLSTYNHNVYVAQDVNTS